MPIYEYECRRCQRRLETMQRLGDPPLAECPECGGELRKLVSAPAFHLKGSGWYVTDYAKKGGDAGKGGGGEGKAADAGGDKAGDAGSAGDKGGEAKGGGAAGKETAPSKGGAGGAKAAGGASS